MADGCMFFLFVLRPVPTQLWKVWKRFNTTASNFLSIVSKRWSKQDKSKKLFLAEYGKLKGCQTPKEGKKNTSRSLTCYDNCESIVDCLRKTNEVKYRSKDNIFKYKPRPISLMVVDNVSLTVVYNKSYSKQSLFY